MMAHQATMKGACPNCDEGVNVGDLIGKNVVTGLWQHLDCPDSKPLPVCPKCFLQLPLSGKCDCE